MAQGMERESELYHLVGRDVPGAPRAWGRHRDTNWNAIGTRAAGDVGPYHGCPVNTMRPCRACRLVGRDVPGAPRAWGRQRNTHGDANGNASGTRAAGDVGPYHGCPVNTMRPCRPRCVRACRLVGRDVPGAPRQRERHRDANGNANGTPTGTPSGRGPPGTSAPTRRYSATRGLTCFHLQRFRGVPSDRHPPIPCSR